MRRYASVIAAAMAMAGVAAAETPPPAAAPCSACHGANGLSVMPDAPNLAGQPRAYLVEQLKAFRGARRSSETMNLMAKGLSDADIQALADWYSGIVVEVKPRP